MNEEKASQKDQFLRETERQLRMAQVEAALEADNLIHALWNGKPLCTVDANGTVRFSPDNIRSADEDRQLQTVTQTVAQVKEYLRILERAPRLKAVDLDENYKILAEFDDIVLAGRISKNGARFVTWEYDFDHRGVHAGHYFMQNYCRVSTKEEEQASSYEAQCEYYTDKIMSNKEWTMAGIFADAAVIIGLKTIRLKKFQKHGDF